MNTLRHFLTALAATLTLLAAAPPAAAQAPGSLDPGYDPNVTGGSNPVYATAVQPDGKTIIGGNFTMVGGASHKNLARLNTDGTVDASFTASTVGDVNCVAVQADGKLVIGGDFTSVNGMTGINGIARLNADGTRDAGFNPGGAGTNGIVYCVAVQADGKLLLGGDFTSVNTTAGIYYVARLNADGTLDAGFNAGGTGAYSHVFSVTVQADGKLVLGGIGIVARLNADGTRDTGFNGGGTQVNSAVLTMAVQADGKFVIGGYFTSVNGTTRINRVARLNADGTLDTGFNAGGTGVDSDFAAVHSVAVQADGKLLLGGHFTSVNDTVGINRIARLNSDGTLDAGFDTGGTGPNNAVLSVAVQADGKLLLGGAFTGVNETERNHLARLNNDLATESLTAPDSTQVLWQRGGASPEVSQVTFELSTDDGNIWTALGAGTRVGTTADWQLAGLSLPGSGTLRARGRTASGCHSGSSGLVETIRNFPDFTPAAYTTVATALNSTGATLNGIVTSNGGPTDVAFQYSTDATLASSVTATTVQTLPREASGIAVSQAISGLAPHTTYYFRTSAVNSSATTAGAILSFATTNTLPTAPDGTATATTGDRRTITLPFPSPDADADTVTLTSTTPDGHLTVDDTSGKDVTFAPTANYVGPAALGYTVSDGFGGTASGTITVTITDNDAPTIAGPFSPLTFTVSQGGTVALPDYTTQAVSSDNVGVTSVTQSPTAATFVAEGVVVVTLTAHDAEGNTADVNFGVVVGTAALATKSGNVPGAGVDPRIPAGTKWGTFGVPSITMDGENANWLGMALTPAGRSFHGIFTGPILAPTLRLRTGEPVRDANGAAMAGVVFKSFREPVYAGDDFAVAATVHGAHVGAGNDTGLWVGKPGTLRQIALEGAAAPGAEPAKFKAFTSLAMPAPGVVFFTAKLTAPAAKDMGLWVWTAATGTKLALVEGAFVNLGAGPAALKSFQALTSVNGSFGHGRYDAGAPALDVRLSFADPDRTTAIGTVAADGSVRVTQRSGQTDPNGRVPVSFGLPSSPGQGLGAMAVTTFAPDAARGITPTSMVTIYDFEEGAIRAQQGMAAPGAEPATFKRFLDPVAGFGFDGGRVQFFAASLAGAARSGDSGLWAFTSSLALVAREGAEPPGAPGTKWKSFTSLSVLEGRGPMFTAKLASGTAKVTAKNDTGLWATDSTGALRLVFREGDAVAGKTMRSFDVLDAVAGSPGQRRAWTNGDASARVIYRAFCTDGTSAVVSTAVP